MNKKYIKDFEAGEVLTTPLLITNAVNGVTANSSPYLSITFSDNTGTIEGKLWDVKEEQIRIATVGKVVNVNFDVISYRNQLQVKVHSLMPIEEGEYDMADFVKSAAISREELENEIYSTITSLNNPTYALIVREIMKENEEKFFLHPAASKIHHNYVRGLAEHTCGMLKHGKAICDIYPSLNRDLLLSGIIIHDIGKIRELSSGLATEYTKEGKLLGHISIMQAYIYEICKRLEVEETEECLLLRHMVLAHHGELEFGSPVMPLIPEAEVLASIDKLDATMNILDKAFEETKAGEFTGKIFALENRTFYKAK